MRRIDKAFSVFKGKARCEIIPNYCPYNVDPRLPDVDGNTYREETECREQGCRGISCEECWDVELETCMKNIEIQIDFGRGKIHSATISVDENAIKEDIDKFVNDTFANSGVKYSWHDK